MGNYIHDYLFSAWRFERVFQDIRSICFLAWTCAIVADALGMLSHPSRAPGREEILEIPSVAVNVMNNREYVMCEVEVVCGQEPTKIKRVAVSMAGREVHRQIQAGRPVGFKIQQRTGPNYNLNNQFRVMLGNIKVDHWCCRYTE